MPDPSPEGYDEGAWAGAIGRDESFSQLRWRSYSVHGMVMSGQAMKRVLIFRAGALGDTILATVLARSLKKYHPEVQIDFLVAKGLEGLFPLIPYVDRTFVFGSRKIPLELDPWKGRLLRTLKRQEYDLALLLETNWLFARFFSKLHAYQKLSIAPYISSQKKPTNLHTVMRYQEILWDAGITPREILSPSLCVPVREKERLLGLLGGLGLDLERPLVGLLPGNSFRERKKLRRWTRYMDLRSWPEDRWVHLIQTLHHASPGVQFVLIGSRWDRAVNQRILEGIRRRGGHIQAVSTAGMTDIPMVAALMERFRVFISTDSGPIHMAAALGIHIVGLYGPTRFEETRPFGDERSVRVLRKELPCQPCYGTSLQKRCRENVCMKAIEVSHVMGAIEDLGVVPHTEVQ